MEHSGANSRVLSRAEASHPFLKGWNTAGLMILRYWIIGLGIASYVGAAFLPALFSPLFVWRQSSWTVAVENALGVLSISGTIALLGFGSRDVQKLASLRGENEVLKKLVEGFGRDLFDVWHMQLALWSRELEFGGEERISLYKHSENRFIMLGRYSENGRYALKGRGVYPEDEGCIGEAWRSPNGYAGLDGLPDSEADPEGYLDDQQGRGKMPRGTMGLLRMKPRSIAAFSIMDETGTRRSAIIVFESTNPNKFSSLGLGDFLRAGKARQVTLLMAAMKNQEPSLEYATQEGF